VIDSPAFIPAPEASNSAADSRARRWLVLYPRAIPLVIFLAIAAITALSVFAIESNARARERAQMGEYARSVSAALDRSSNSFSSYLRSGAALFASSADVAPETFDSFVRALKLDMDYPGAEGIGWLPVIEPAEVPGFMARTRASQPGFPDIYPRPRLHHRADRAGDDVCARQRAQPPGAGL
jgi:CHASE1-domain containing sensor protein